MACILHLFFFLVIVCWQVGGYVYVCVHACMHVCNVCKYLINVCIYVVIYM